MRVGRLPCRQLGFCLGRTKRRRAALGNLPTLTYSSSYFPVPGPSWQLACQRPCIPGIRAPTLPLLSLLSLHRLRKNPPRCCLLRTRLTSRRSGQRFATTLLTMSRRPLRGKDPPLPAHILGPTPTPGLHWPPLTILAPDPAPSPSFFASP